MFTMADSIEPYQFELLMTLEELKAFKERRSNRNNEDSAGKEKEGSDEDCRISTNQWCSCGSCVAMPSSEELICCKELHEVRVRMGQITCITRHPPFADDMVVMAELVEGLQSNLKYQVSSIKYSYFTWGTISQRLLLVAPRKESKKYMHTKQTQKPTHK